MKHACASDTEEVQELLTARIEVLRTLIEANDKSYSQRFDSVVTATQAALAAADRAVNKAETASEKRFESINEFRATLADQQRTLMPRAEAELLMKSINDKIDALNLTTTTKLGRDTGTREGMAVVALISGLIATIITIGSRFIK